MGNFTIWFGISVILAVSAIDRMGVWLGGVLLGIEFGFIAGRASLRNGDWLELR